MPSLSTAVLRLRDFRLLLLVRVFGFIALQAQDVIIGWQVYSLTKDPFMLGLTGLTAAVPFIACALFAGHIVDISRPHRVFMWSCAVMTGNILALLLFTSGAVHGPGGILPWLFVGIFISGIARSFIGPSIFSLVSGIVERKDIPATSGWMISGFQLAMICGPALAGLIYGGYGVKAAWTMTLMFMSGAFILLIAMSQAARHYKGAEQREPAVKSIKKGWKFILKNPVLLSIMALDMFAVMFGGVVAILPIYADQVLHVGAHGLGILRAAPAIGAIVSSLWLAVWPFTRIRATQLLSAITGFGICMIAFGLSTNFALSMGLLILSGAFDSISMVIRSTLMQWLTPTAMRGRVSSVNSIFIISSNEIGAFESGVAAKLFGLVPSVVGGGCVTLLVVAATAWLSPQFRRASVHPDDPVTL